MAGRADRALARALGALVELYALAVSPLFPPTCRFTPTCSRYAVEALEAHPLPRALWLIAKRLARCNGLFDGGFDPVPR